MYKRIISLLLMLNFVLTAVGPVWAQENEADIFSSDFESYLPSQKVPEGFSDASVGTMGWPTTKNCCTPHIDESGNKALKISALSTGVALRKDFDEGLDSGRYYIGMKVKNDFPIGSKITPNMYISNASMQNRVGIDMKLSLSEAPSDADGYSQLNIIVDLDANIITSWAGDDSSKASTPVGFNYTMDQLFFAFWGEANKNAAIYIDDLIVKKLPVSIIMDTQTSTFGNIFFGEEKQNIPVKILNSFKKDMPVSISYNAITRQGKKILDESMEAVIPANGEYLLNVEPDMEEYTIAELNMTVTDETGETTTKSFDFSHVNAGDLLNSFLGTCDKSLLHGNTNEARMRLIAKAGFGQIRDNPEWHRMETVKGTVEPRSMWPAFFENVNKYNIDYLAQLGYGNDFYDGGGLPYTNEGRAAFGQYTDVLTRFMNSYNHHYFEIWNEFDLTGTGFNKTSRPTVDYRNLMIETSKKIREIDPKAFIVGGVQANIKSLEWTRTVLSEGGAAAIDALSTHPYNHTTPPETAGFRENAKAMRETIDEFDPDIELWFTELGEFTSLNQANPSRIHPMEDSSAINIRYYLLAEGYKLADKMFLYLFADDGIDDSNAENVYGIVKCGGGVSVPNAAKMGYLSMAFVNKMVADSEHIEINEYEDNRFISRYKKKSGEDLLVCWSVEHEKSIGLKSDKPVDIYDTYGNYLGKLNPVDGVLNVNIGFEPIYLVGDISKTEVCEPIICPEKGFCTAIVADAVDVKIINNSSEKLSLTIQDDTEYIDVLQNNGADEFRLALTDKAIEFNTIRYTLSDEEGNVLYYGKYDITKSGKPIEVTINSAPFNLKNENRWCVSVNIKNITQSLVFNGKSKITSPSEFSEYAKTMEFSNLKPGNTVNVKINLPELVKKTAKTISVQTDIDNGYSVTTEKAMSFALAGYADKKIVIDGIRDDGEYTGTTIPLGTDRWVTFNSADPYKGAKDLSAVASMMWDVDNLYLYVDVTDDVHHNSSNRDAIYEGDGIQLGIDDVSGAAIYASEYTELGAALTDSGPQFWRWKSIIGKTGEVTNIEFVSKRDKGHTYYEMRIPWSEIIVDTTKMLSYTEFGFNVLVNDNDGKVRKGYVEHSSGIGNGQKVTTNFHRIVLARPESIEQ